MLREILITGMEGMTGSHLARAALDIGLQVSGTHYPQASNGNIIDLFERPGLNVFSCDLTDRADVRNLMASINPNVIFHLAGKANNGRSWLDDTLSANTAMCLNLLQGVVDRKPKPRIILASTVNVYRQQVGEESITEDRQPDPETPYALSKTTQEQLVNLYGERFGLEAVVVRCSQHTGRGRAAGFVEYDIGQQIIAMERGESPLQISVRNAAAEVDLLDVRDVVGAYLLLAGKGVSGEVYNVASGYARSVREVAQLMIAASRLSDKEGIGICSTGSERFLPARYANHKILSLGWEPQFTLPQTLKDFLDWMREK